VTCLTEENRTRGPDARFRMTDRLLIVMMILPLVCCIALKVCFTPESEGVDISGAMIYLTIRGFPVQDLEIGSARVADGVRLGHFDAKIGVVAGGLSPVPPPHGGAGGLQDGQGDPGLFRAHEAVDACPGVVRGIELPDKDQGVRLGRPHRVEHEPTDPDGPPQPVAGVLGEVSCDHCTPPILPVYDGAGDFAPIRCVPAGFLL